MNLYKAISITAVGAVMTVVMAGAAHAATVQYVLSDCNNSAACSSQYGNNFGTVTVTDTAAGVVSVNVNLEDNYVWARTGLVGFGFSLAAGVAAPTLSSVTAPYWTPISGNALTSFNFNGMGSQQYGLDFTGPNDSVSADLDFTLTASGLSTASFAPGGTSADTGKKYYFIADICTDSDGRCSEQTANASGLVGAALPVPLPAAVWLLLSGLGGLGLLGRRKA